VSSAVSGAFSTPLENPRERLIRTPARSCMGSCVVCSQCSPNIVMLLILVVLQHHVISSRNVLDRVPFNISLYRTPHDIVHILEASIAV
jgi:hypothetical protein